MAKLVRAFQLTNGMWCYVDANKYHMVCKNVWSAKREKTTYYAVKRENVNGKQREIYIHEVLFSPPNGKKCDHIDNNGLNNISKNIRYATPDENARNRRTFKNNTTGVTGVHFNKNRNVWSASIGVRLKLLWLGYFQNKDDAIVARKNAEQEYYGEFANKPIRTLPDESEIEYMPVKPRGLRFMDLPIGVIPLTQGKFALVDDDDWDWLIQYTWAYSNGYAVTTINKKSAYMHRLIMGIESQDLLVDHINRDRCCNYRQNLRIVSDSENNVNRSIDSRNTSGYIGVYFKKENGYYVADFQYKGQRFTKGGFGTAKDAAVERDKFARLYGDGYANLNFFK